MMKKIALLVALAALLISILHRGSTSATSEGEQDRRNSEIALADFHRPSQTTAPKSSGNCADCHQKQSPKAVALFAGSTHAKVGIACSRCHGGNVAAADKQAAHAGRFVGKPSPVEVIAMCGSCHTSERAAFKTSKHFFVEAGAPKVDCAQCHGAHGVGSVERNFSLASFCSNCHGVEYIPALTVEFQKILSTVDEQVEAMRGLKSQGRNPSDDVITRRKQMRHLIGEIVHATDFGSGIEKLPQILKLADEFKQAVEREKR